MAFCYKCGEQLEPDNKFCINCGAPAQGIAAPPTPPPQQVKIHGSELSVYLQEVKDLFLGMVLSPISSIRSLAKGPFFQASFVLAILLAVGQGLLSMWLASATADSLSDLLGFFSPFGRSSFHADIPYGSIFGYSLLFALTSLGGMFAGTYLIGRFLFKGRDNSLAAWNIVVASSVPTFCGLVLAIIFSYMSILLGLAVWFMGGIIAILCVYVGVTESMELSEDRAAFSVPLIYAVMFLVQYLVIKIIA